MPFLSIRSRVLVACAAVLSSTLAFAAIGSSTARPRITQANDNARLTTLEHNVRAELTPATDLGPVDDSMRIERMTIVLQRAPEQQAALATLIDRQHQPTAPEFHKWLTPAEFGERFGAASTDIAKLTDWLTAQGFTVRSVLNNNSMIEFSGTAGQVREAFHTELHALNYKGQGAEAGIYANNNDPRVPAALAPIIAGITGLNDIPLQHNHTVPRSASFDPQTHRWHENASTTAVPFVKPNYSDGEGDYFVTPQDYYTIYNVNPVYTAGDKGSTATVAVVEQSDIAYGTVTNNVATGGDVTTFRNTFGVAGTLNMYVYHGYGNVVCADPGVKEGDEVEATLDAEWANALAPSAKLVFMSCSTTDGGVIESLTALIDGNLSDAMSMSYGNSELNYTSGDFSTLDTLYSQAATQGQSVFVSTGDSGSDVDDQNVTKTAAIHGINVSALSGSPYVTATGGTDFQDLYDSLVGGPAQTAYWGATNSSAYADALGYVPEMSWNDSCASSILAAYNSSTPAAFCGEDPTNSQGYSFIIGDVVGGSGGFSTHYTVPSYQTGITGYSGTMRAQPDIAMFASSGFWGHALLFCDSDTTDPDGDKTANCSSSTDFGIAGGTSFVAPAMAGIAGLLVDYTGSRQGVLNYALYALGKAQYTASSTKTACYSNGQTNNTGVTTGLPSSACIFNDVTTSNNDEGCAAGSTDCYVNSGESYGVLSIGGASSLTIAYPSTAGYDEVSGIGTLNVYNLLTKWNTAFTTTTTLKASATSISTSQSTTLTATVTGGVPAGYNGPSPALAGTVKFLSGTTQVGTCTLASGSCNVSVTGATLGAGTDSVTAVFEGSTAYPTSTSSVVTVTVTSPTATTSTTVTATPGTSTYGESVALKATVTASSGTATGTVSFTTGSTTLGSCTLSSGTCTANTTALPLGTETVTASYGGVTGFSASSGTVSVTVNAASTTTTVTATPSSAAFGASVALKASVTSSGGTPTGIVTFKNGSTTLGSCTLSSGTCTYSTTALPVGPLTITAAYAGSTDFAVSSGTTGVTITTDTTTTAVTATPTSASFGASVALKATVTSSGGTPTGTVTFKNGSTTLGSCTLSSGTCTYSTTALPVGSLTITASYGGATDFAISSGTASVTVTAASTTTTLAITPSPAASGQQLSFKATTTSSGGTPTGTINISYGSIIFETCTLSGGTCTTTLLVSLPVGTYSVNINYLGSTNFAASSSKTNITITAAATTTTLVVTPNPATPSQALTLTATVKRPSGYTGVATGKVNFYYSTLLLGTGTLNSSGVATYTQPAVNLPAGTYSLKAEYAGDANDQASSGTGSATIN